MFTTCRTLLVEEFNKQNERHFKCSNDVIRIPTAKSPLSRISMIDNRLTFLLMNPSSRTELYDDVDDVTSFSALDVVEINHTDEPLSIFTEIPGVEGG